MVKPLPAIYEHGILRLLEPLVLPESSRVSVQILQDERDEREASYQRCLWDLYRFLTSIDQNWSNPLVQEAFRRRIEPDLRALWHLSAPATRELCGILVLASAQLHSAQATQEQIHVFLFALDVLINVLAEKKSLTDAEIDACYDRLTLAGLPPSLSLNERALQSYLDEL